MTEPPMPSFAKTPLNVLLLIVLAAAIAHPFLYFNTFSGDAEIHLVYAHNFLEGYPLQFNPGEPSSGQTSMGFMFLVVVPAMKLLGEYWTPVAMKLVGLCSLYVIAFESWFLARRLDLEKPWALLAAVATLFVPGSVANGMLGSENAFFGALVLGWTLLALSRGWLSPAGPRLGDDVLLAVFMGAMFWIRPETIPFGGVAWLVRGTRNIAARRRLDPMLLGRGLLFGAVAGMFVLAYVLLFKYWTGILPFGAGYARLIESIDVDSVWILGLAVNVKVLIRLAAYGSVVAPALYALWLASRRQDDRVRWLLILIGAEFAGQMTAYSFNLVTALHFARYTIYVWPFGMVAASYGLSRLARAEGVLRFAPALCIAAFIGMAIYESTLRNDFPHDQLIAPMTMPELRPHYSDELLARWGQPKMRPVVIAAQEVQSRDYLDHRFVIRSLDGILDVVFLKYLCNGYNDHDGYFIDQKVDFVVTPFVNYNHDRARWSLAKLNALPIGQSIERPGIRYTKIRPASVKVTRLVARSQDRAIQPCQLQPGSPYY
jgi:hypothetical protein